MSGIGALLLLVFVASLPVLVIFFCFRAKKSPVTLPWFLASLAAGIISLLVAALIQNIFPFFSENEQNGPRAAFFNMFIRIAFIEEASRFVALVFLLRVAKLRRMERMDRSFCAALGLVAGLGFAMLENAFYGMANINIALLRAFAAAPLHGACGIRIGVAVFSLRRRPAKSLFCFIFTVLLHGAYNLIIANPALPLALAIFTAFAALFASLPFLKTAKEDGETPFFPISGP